MNNKYTLSLTTLLLIAFAYLPTTVFAEFPGTITNPVLSDTLQNMTGVEYLQSFIPSLVGLVLVIGSIVFFFVFIIGAIQWMVSGGDKAAVEQARGKVTNALVGLVILFSAFAIVLAVEAFFDVDILTIDIGVLKIE